MAKTQHDITYPYLTKAQAKAMQRHEVRFLVDNYYMWQDQRKRVDQQLGKASFPVLETQLAIFDQLEKCAKRDLGTWAAIDPMAIWAMENKGVGAIIAAGLSAHIDIEKAPVRSSLWKFAGLDGPSENQKLKKGEKRTFNARLKVICWHLGQSFMKLSNDPECFYGQLYRQRKLMEQERNDAGEHAEQAADLATKVGKTTVAYKSNIAGKLSAGHIDARARRYAVKHFLSRWWEVAYERHHGTKPPDCYAIAHMGHGHPMQHAV